MNSTVSLSNKILTIAFAAIISLPLIVNIVGIQTTTMTSENRNVQGFPSFEIRATTSSPGLRGKISSVYAASVRYIRKFDDYFSDSFGLRSALLKCYNTVKLQILHTNPLPEKVVMGREHWFFLGDSNSHEIKESKGIENFSGPELRKVVDRLISLQTRFDQQKIPLYLAVAPNKVSVYGEFLPIEKSVRKTKTVQLDSAGGTQFELIDLKANFAEHLGVRLFHKTDSHWNDQGALVAYTTLMRRITQDFPDVKTVSGPDYTQDTITTSQQDLTRLLDLRMDEQVITFTKKESTANLAPDQLVPPKNYDRASDDYEERYASRANRLKVLIFRDSFTTHMVKFLKESFGETVFIWRHQFDDQLIAREKPDLVIQIIVERNIELIGR